jgi:hypothetical protein
MKTFALFVAAILFLVTISPAQMHIGLAGGVNFSEADQNNFYSSKASSTAGYVIGGILDCPITKNLSFLIEPTYVEKGTYAEPVNFRGIVPKLSFDLSYLELPVLLKYSVGKDLKPYLVLGPSLGFNLSSNMGAEISGPWLGQLEVMANAGNMVHQVECSIEFGGGLSYQPDEMLTLFVEARYARALSNTLRRGGVVVSTMDETIAVGALNNAVYKNKGFIVLFGFSLPL